MSKVLFIEYYKQPGHVNFNRIHIDALLRAGAEVRLVMHRKVAEKLPYPKEMYCLVLPAWLEHKQGHPFFNRLVLCLTLLYIKCRVPISSFDRVILSYWEETTLGLIPLCRGMYLICHGNAASFSSGLKSLFMKRLACYNHFVVFNERMASPFLERGIRNVHILSHGCMPPFTLPEELRVSPFDKSRYDYVVFHPSGNVDGDFIQSLNDASFLEFLQRERILLVLRNKPAGFPACPNIVFKSGFLKTEEYRQMLLYSDAVLLAYPPDFQYQVSGVSFECISNRKNLLVKYTPALAYCGDFYNYNPFFTTVEELRELLLVMKSEPERCCVASADQLQPDYTGILS